LSFGLIRALQSLEFRGYFQAVKEAFARPIERQELPPSLLKQLDSFWRQNSLFHQWLGRN
jgi:hypothetical protein